jgi:hypothetical protein
VNYEKIDNQYFQVVVVHKMNCALLSYLVAAWFAYQLTMDQYISLTDQEDTFYTFRFVIAAAFHFLEV